MNAVLEDLVVGQVVLIDDEDGPLWVRGDRARLVGTTGTYLLAQVERTGETWLFLRDELIAIPAGQVER
ncbi:MAG: hypothetical protein M3N21_08835 [Actinomycetota bacterium]|nr:hypothetical protein [Actinomycetota bacterium]